MAPKKSSIHGNVEVSLREGKIEAVLRFTPSAAVHEFDTGDLVRMLAEKNIKEGVSPQNLEKILKQMERAKEAFEAPVARGIAPEKPEAENPVWEKLPIPERFTEDAERAMRGAGAPVITQEKVEKIKSEKTVEKKATLPFLPAKKETMTVFEKKVSSERVYVDPHVEGKGWVTEGMRIALLEPMKNGTPGKAADGSIIPAEILTEPYVYAGRGVEKKKGELTALETGFVRWGKNWAEIVSFKPHFWELTLSPEKSSCLLSFSPGSREAKAPTASDIVRAAADLSYQKELLLPEDEIQQLIGNILSGGVPVKSVPINLAGDAEIRVDVTEDKLKATLYLRKGRGGGKTLSLKEAGAIIKAGNFKGLDFEKIKTDVLEFYRGEAQELPSYLLAEGRPATEGTDRKVECSVRFFEPKITDGLKKAASERPMALEGIASLAGFPIDAVEEIGPVEKEQRVLVFGPPAYGQPGVDVRGSVIPGLPGKDPKIVLRENLDKKDNVVISKIQGILERRKTDTGFEMRIRPHKDGETKVTLSPNRMEGYLTLFPSEGTGRPLDLDEIKLEFKQAGIVQGIREEVVQAAFEKASEGQTIVDLPFAMGKFPQEGSSNRVKFLIHIASLEKVNIRKDGSADFKNRDNITTVREGALIAEILPPELLPENGWDITGKPIPAKTETAFDLEIGENIRQEKKDDKTVLIAGKNGELLYDKKKIDIQEAHLIKGNVDLSTGNIKFPGSVHISGSVDAGFYVVSGGDIKITEGVDAALISADGSIFIQQGVKGGGRAVLRAKKNIGASFLEQAVVLSVGDVKIKNSCMRCTVRCNGKLELLTEKGVIIGGVVKARMGIVAASLGSERGGKTEISFGQDYLVADQIELEEKEIKKLTAMSAKLDSLMKLSEKGRDRDGLERHRQEKVKALKLIEKRSLRLFTLREKFEEHYPAEILVRGAVYPGVVIESHGRYHEFTAPKKGVRIIFDEQTGRITEAPLDKGEAKE